MRPAQPERQRGQWVQGRQGDGWESTGCREWSRRCDCRGNGRGDLPGGASLTIIRFLGFNPEFCWESPEAFSTEVA